MQIPITFLGTSSAIPTKSRNHISIFMNYKEENILIDCGEGTQRQFRLSELNPCKLTRLLITHFHGDHVFGLPGLFQTLALNNYQKTLYIYGPRGTKKFIEEMFRLLIKNYKIKTEIKEVNGKFLETKDFNLLALPLDHDTPTNGYLFQEKDKLRIKKDKLKKLKIGEKNPELKKLVQGKDIKINGKTLKSKEFTYLQKGKKIAFILDTKITENAKKLAKDADLVIAETTFLKENNGEELAHEYKHLTAEEAGKIAKSGNAKQLILTHFSQRYEHKEHLLLQEAKKVFPNTKLSEDLMKIEI